jgi:putative transposase
MRDDERHRQVAQRRHFDRDATVLCVRWYLRCKPSLRDLVEMTSERDQSLAHTTILRRVKRFTPDFVKRWNRLAMTPDQAWRIDETGRPLTRLLYLHHIWV